ncbi:hypothetical protein DMENIID0001_122580 [Sergentomyia squamirostris]
MLMSSECKNCFFVFRSVCTAPSHMDLRDYEFLGRRKKKKKKWIDGRCWNCELCSKMFEGKKVVLKCKHSRQKAKEDLRDGENLKSNRGKLHGNIDSKTRDELFAVKYPPTPKKKHKSNMIRQLWEPYRKRCVSLRVGVFARIKKDDDNKT